MNPFASGWPRKGSSTRQRRSWTRRIAAVVGLAMVPGLLTPVAFAADKDPLGKPKLSAPHSSKVTPFTAKANKKNATTVANSAKADRTAAQRARTDQTRKAAWPTSGSATLTLPAKKPATGRTKSTAKADPGSLPLTLTAPKAAKTKIHAAGKKKQPKTAREVTARVLDQKTARRLGIKGVVLTVTGPSSGGSAQLDIDYSAFASSYGGDWAGRLRVLRLPACALSTPSKKKCRTLDTVAFTNDRGDKTLTSQLSFAPATTSTTSTTATPAALTGETMILALAAGTQSGAGDYKATPLSASSTWEAGGSSGSFTWSYPLRTPPAAAGPAPDLSISYDSGSIDGRTANTNNQGSQVGEGFDLTSSYVERKYGSCDDDGQDDRYDLCWKYDNASLVLNGKANELVKDDTTGEWHLKNDDASKVEHLTGAGNGDDDGEYWRVTTGNGTQYTFGKHKLPGWRSDDPATTGTVDPDDTTDSTWLVPVYGDDTGEPGYDKGSDFSGRSLVQAWRWNLDYVVDTHDNVMAYYYAKETNYYAKNASTTNSSYTRGGYLKSIEYGLRSGSIFTTPAAQKVTFGYSQRCTATDCSSLTESTRDNWPDVPYDTICTSATDDCTGNNGPSFFTRYRLTSLNTYAWDATAATPAYEPVDTWALKHLYLDPGDTGDSTDQSLFLDQITHTGKHGTDLALDPVKFTHVFLPNRVESQTDGILPFNRPRLRTVTSEAGAQTIVNYAAAECVAGQTMPSVDQNTKRCYPVYWSPNGASTPILDWFQKYPVTSVSTTDPYGGSEAVQHTYTYSGGGAWHYNDDPLTPEKERTWSIWRGYERVTHLTGDSDSAQLKTITVYMRGMNGDRVLGTDGKTPDPDKRKTVTLTGILAPAATDLDRYAGFTRETVTYNGAAEVSGTINSIWTKRTAIQHKSYADTEAYMVRVSANTIRTRVTTTGTAVNRVRGISYTYDAMGMVSATEDVGDKAVTGDETCTRTWYARNDTKGINALVSRTRKTAGPCTIADADLDLRADSKLPGDVISDTATAYDTTTWSAGQTPTKGEAQWTGRAKSYNTDDTPVWQKVATTTYDTLGRPLAVKDTNDLTVSTTAYTPATTPNPVTSTTVTNAKSQTTTTAFDFATGSPLKVTDPNGKVTETEYDSLGRTTKVWLPNHLRVLFDATPNYVYNYKITSTAMPWVSTGTLKGDASGYNTAYAFYDSQLRPRQTQTPSPVGGRLVSLTLYDDRGLAVSAQGDIWDETSAPSAAPVQTEGSQAPIQTDTTYDGAGRVTKTETKNFGATRWSIDTTYTGDTVATSAPDHGQATAVVTNALGQTTLRREYGGPQPTGIDFTTTSYGYTPAGQQETVTGPDQTKWSYSYDLFGRQVSATDPDKGTTTTEYDSLDRTSTTTDPEHTLLYGYDDLNRTTGLWQTSKTDANKLAAWTFDTLAKGQQDTAVRYDGGLTGKAYTTKVTSYNSLYQVTGSELTLPDKDKEALVAAGVPQTLSFTTGYRLDGTVSQTSQPAVAGLASETLSYTYNATGGQLTAAGTTGYLQGAVYSPQGDLRQLTLGMDGASSAKKAYLNYDYEAGTRRLTRSYVTDDVHGYMPQELKFTQDDAGNVTSIFDASTQGGTTKADYQCFTYDGNRRLDHAWTPKSADCATSGRTTANLDGAAPYWTSYTYQKSGQRETETQHTASGDTTTNYAYGTTRGQPHPLTTTTGPKTSTYDYDKTGNTTSRPGTQAQQTLVWNSEGKLASTSEPAAGSKLKLETSYLYDAGGQLLIRRATGDGDTVLYLGGTEVRLTTKGTTKTLSGTRYYTAAGQTIAVRTATSGTTGTKLNFLAADPHGTASLVLDATNWAITKRYTTPFGATRGTTPTTWPDDKRFLGKPADTTTGLTHIGAREYDPGIGQFISVDPILSLGQHQSLNGYSYANQHPTTSSDPTGLCDDPVGNGKCQKGKFGKDAVDTAYPTNLNPKPNGTAPTGSTGSTGSTDSDDGGMVCTGTGLATYCHSPGSGPQDTETSAGNYLGSLLSNQDFWSGLLDTLTGAVGWGGGIVIGGSGVVACGTVVLCEVGAPAIAGGVGLVIAGSPFLSSGSDKLGRAFREADEASPGSSGGKKAAKDGGDLGENWKAKSPSEIRGSNGCEDCAVEIQSKIGGERMRISDKFGAPTLGKYRKHDSEWAHHDVVVRDGRVYDAWTGRRGEAMEDYMAEWEWSEYLVMSPSPYVP
ncbi:RHS repeat-associated core domain-containing protein [Streptomyces sp. NPDC005525]|uniref:RHS repeat-associated core domain-containing protein n=1 Tax=Streptomyces sp. NPDC005525 TaxID=3364720 RepID=UPI0036A1D99C